MGEQQYGIDSNRLLQYAKEIREVTDLGVEVAVVIGGGNIFRGVQAEQVGLDRVQGDYMGMLATVINSMALQSALAKLGVYTRLLSGINIQQVCEPYIRRRAVRHLEKGRVVIFGAGTGNPYFSTDTTAVLRAAEINAEVILLAKNIDGVYNADPAKDPSAVRYDSISYDDVLAQHLAVMDTTATSLSMDNHIPVLVFALKDPKNIIRALCGEKVGTIVGETK